MTVSAKLRLAAVKYVYLLTLQCSAGGWYFTATQDNLS